eukprot:GEMP01005493.1.p1 GENE.GEMP01005493.1~~GEMP01005493.1.p1  ORF type:complete len:756 (+),score=167.12 GEMP01005493.1:68-2269(+)
MFVNQKKIDGSMDMLESRLKLYVESFVNGKVTTLENTIAGLPFPSIREEIESVRARGHHDRGNLEKSLAGLKAIVTSNKEEHDGALAELCKKSARKMETMDEIDASIRHDLHELAKTVETHHFAHVEALEHETLARRKVREGVDANSLRIDQLRNVCDESDAHRKELTTQVDEIASQIAKTMAEFEILQTELHETMRTIQDSRVAFHEEKAAQAQVITVDIPLKLQDLQRRMEEECKAPLKVLDTTLLSALRDIDVVRTSHTRGLHWVVTNFREKLSHMLTNNSTMWSPEFSVVGQPPGIINLHVHALRSGEKPTQRIGMEVQRMASEAQQTTPIPVPGLLSIDFWFPVGMSMTFKITVGKTSRTVEHHFEGTPGERACCACQNFCNLDQVWDRRKDSIAITFDLLDLRATEVITTAKLEVPTEAALAVCNVDQAETMSRSLHVGSEAAILEKLNKQLTAIKNRWVRQVEWEIRNISDMVGKTAAGDSIESPVIAASGIERMRLVFYPKGVKDGGPTGQCGLFLACPQDARMKFALSVGKQRRVLEHVFLNHQGSTGDLCGKAKFCTLEHQMEDRAHPSQQRVVILLEILEVELLTAVQNKASDHTLIRRLDPSAFDELKKVISLPSVDSRNIKATISAVASRALSRSRTKDEPGVFILDATAAAALEHPRPHTTNNALGRERTLSRERSLRTQTRGMAQQQCEPLNLQSATADGAAQDHGTSLDRPQSQPVF